MDQNSKIILRRPDEWLNRARPFKVLIDGIEVGNIKTGASEEYILSAGTHRIQCTISWYSSPELIVNLSAGRVEYIQVRSGMKYYWYLFFVLLVGISVNLFFIGREGGKPLWASLIQLLLILPALVYMLYYLTVARKQYLIIEEDKENIFVS